ncbi:MAG: aminotransferase class V-fold PLP-dependent enzyme, partial [Alphaproteobacteria bacterium]|nr:aminotransferase class V-fold PLP-dependent enzyme [Alphaproteobacteria bacterium]
MTTPTPVYLDYNATAPIHPQVADEVALALRLVGNPSSVHQAGRQARSVIEEARMRVARLVNANPSEIVFTSGGTEANAMAILGADAERLICMASEHSSVLEPAQHAGKPFETCPVDNDGLIRLDALRKALEAGGKALVCVQLANNETGVIQPVHEVARLVHEYDGLLHMDATQGVGKIPVDIATLGADFAALSAHKIGGPAGVGALIIRKGHDMPALLKGGGQESRRRSGTENLIGIAGFGEAAKIAREEISAYAGLARLRDEMEAAILDASDGKALIYG